MVLIMDKFNQSSTVNGIPRLKGLTLIRNRILSWLSHIKAPCLVHSLLALPSCLLSPAASQLRMHLSTAKPHYRIWKWRGALSTENQQSARLGRALGLESGNPNSEYWSRLYEWLIYLARKLENCSWYHLHSYLWCLLSTQSSFVSSTLWGCIWGVVSQQTAHCVVSPCRGGPLRSAWVLWGMSNQTQNSQSSVPNLSFYQCKWHRYGRITCFQSCSPWGLAMKLIKSHSQNNWYKILRLTQCSKNYICKIITNGTQDHFYFEIDRGCNG